MVATQRFFRTDPNKLGRKGGVYYRRGRYYKGVDYQKKNNMRSDVPKKLWGYYSLYNIKRDMKIKAKGYKIHKVGIPNRSSIKHTGDGRLPR